MGNYRIGFSFEDETVKLSRVAMLHTCARAGTGFHSYLFSCERCGIQETTIL